LLRVYFQHTDDQFTASHSFKFWLNSAGKFKCTVCEQSCMCRVCSNWFV